MRAKITHYARRLAHGLELIAQRLERPIILIDVERLDAPRVMIDGQLVQYGTFRFYGRITWLDYRRYAIDHLTRVTLDHQPIDPGALIEVIRHYPPTLAEQAAELAAIPTHTRRSTT